MRVSPEPALEIACATVYLLKKDVYKPSRIIKSLILLVCAAQIGFSIAVLNNLRGVDAQIMIIFVIIYRTLFGVWVYISYHKEKFDGNHVNCLGTYTACLACVLVYLCFSITFTVRYWFFSMDINGSRVIYVEIIFNTLYSLGWGVQCV